MLKPQPHAGISLMKAMLASPFTTLLNLSENNIRSYIIERIQGVPIYLFIYLLICLSWS